MFQTKVKCVVLAAMALGVGAACAADGDSMLKVTGFGTLGVNHSSEKNADYVTSSTQPSGSGHTRDWDWRNNSRLGAQIDAKLTETLSASVQLLAEQSHTSSFRGDVQLANLKWQVSPTTSFRLGRLPLGLYMVSDYQKIGYSMPWAQAPLEVYQTSTFSNFDGADATYKRSFGETTLTLNGYMGRTEIRFGDAHISTSKYVMGAVATVESGYHTFRLGYAKAGSTMESPAVDAAMAAARAGYLAGVPGFQNDGQRYAIYKHKKAFTGLGYSYDPGTWFVMSEAVQMGGEEDIYGTHRAAYVTLGYRVNKFTPYATYARQLRRSDLNTGNPVTDAIFAGGPPNGGRHTASAGLRWDFMKNTALKMQYDHTTLDSGSVGMFSNISGPLEESFNVFTAVVDFVF